MRAKVLFSGLTAFFVLAGCKPSDSGGASPTGGTSSTRHSSSSTGGTPGSGGTLSSGGTTASGGTAATGGTMASGGTAAISGGSESGGTSGPGDTTGTGGDTARGGTTSNGGTAGTGGTIGSGGQSGTGGTSRSGGATSSGGMSGTGGRTGTGGAGPTGGRSGTGGSATGGSATGGSATGSSSTSGATDGGAATIDCNAAMPSGGQQHSGNSQGGSGNLAWQIWSNAGSGNLTTFANTPAFSAAWNNSGDYLGRMGFEWGNGGKTYDQYGKITAQFTFKKTGSGGGYSYIGIYGWSTNPCVEWYIIDDSFGTMPFNPYNATSKGTPTSIDGENYKFYSNSTNGTGGSRCNASSWMQFWSVRQKARQCGTITISDHFKGWDAAGMKLGNLLEAKILVETGGGSGSVDFPIANVAKTQ